jgi:hypothetical protein
MWETQRIDMSREENAGGLTIRVPWSDTGRCVLSIPEFYGKTTAESFKIDQGLVWSQDAENPEKVNFALDGDATELGADFHGDITIMEPDEVHVSMSLTNCLDTELKSGRHLMFLGLAGLRDFDDPLGNYTFYYTETGWRSRADLFQAAGINDNSYSVRVGSRLGKSTVIWDIVARTDTRQENMVAFSLNRAFAFTSDHPDWGRGLLTASRWSHLAPGERHYAMGIIYLMKSDLYALEDRYIQNRKRR